MRFLLLLLLVLGGFVLVAMVVAPSQPVLRGWYEVNACPYLDNLSTDICAAIRRASGPKPT